MFPQSHVTAWATPISVTSLNTHIRRLAIGRCTPVACNTPPGEAYTQTGLAPAVLGNKTISKEPLVATQSIKFNC